MFIKKLLIIISLFLAGANLFCQVNINEPEFAGEVFWLKNDGSFIELNKSISQLKHNAFTGLLIPLKGYLQIDSCCSAVRVPSDTMIRLVVKSIDNKTDPMSIIGLFKFDTKRKQRRAEVSSMGFFGSTENNKNYIQYDAVKYGESSYLLTIRMPKKGEYGIVVRNPNSPVNAAAVGVIVSSFGID
jgi:hypothetical protein